MRIALRGLSLLVAILFVGSAWGQTSPAAGDASVFKPEGSGFTPVARVLIGQWATVAK